MNRQSTMAAGAAIVGVAAVATAVVGIGLPLGAAAVILGTRAMREIDGSRGPIGGEGRARLGVYLGRIGAGVASVVLVAAVLSVAVFGLLGARHALAAPATTPASQPATAPASQPGKSMGDLRMDNGMNLVELGKSLVLWSDQFYQNTQDFPRTGLKPDLATIAEYKIASNSVADRLGALVNTGMDPLHTSGLINPKGKDTAAEGKAPKIVLQAKNVSYALLDATNSEWKNKVNAAAPLACDKQVGKGSYWNAKYWEGAVLWGDTHVTFESGEKKDSWPATAINGVANAHDDLFNGTKGEKSTDAVMENP